MTWSKYFRIVLPSLAIAVGLGVLGAGQLVLATMGNEGSYTFSHAVIMQTPFWLFWAPIFPLILLLVDRYPFERATLRRDIAVHVAAAIAITLVHFGFRLWFMHIIGHGYPKGHSFFVHLPEAARYRLWVHFVAYLALLGIALGSHYYRKYRERQLLASQLAAQLSQAKLHALRMQLNPHFLFNALNSIAMLTRRNENALAVRMLAGLGDLLRYVLEDSPADEVLLREEVEFLTRYLEIERVRFHDRLRITTDIADETLDAFVPNLLLQPIVENAIVHGIARKTDTGTIEIAARKLSDRLVLQVSDSGPGLIGIARENAGVGLSNTRKRLEQLYGDQFSLDMRNGDNGGVVVTISLPFQLQPVAEAYIVAG